MMSDPWIEAAGCSDVGRRREHNEDNWAIFPLRPDGMGVACVVADGMGGHNAGEVASARAVAAIQRELGVRYADDPDGALDTVLDQANRLIWEEARKDQAKAGMGTTVVCAVFDGRRVWLANVGDSPAFLASGGVVRPITRDHSWVAEQVEAGAVPPDEAHDHPYRHILTRCLGVDRTVQVAVYEPLDLRPGDTVVLCSDGLTEHVRPEEIGPVLDQALGVEAAARALVDLANQRGGHDNTTVIVARLGG